MVDLRLSPPPWSFHETPWEFRICDAEGCVVATTIYRDAARLMTAAPVLYEACESALTLLENVKAWINLLDDEKAVIAKLEAALRKARGEEP